MKKLNTLSAIEYMTAVLILMFLFFGTAVQADEGNNTVPITSLLLGNSQVSLCSSSDVTQCQDESSCTEAGGYWYNGACHSTPNPGTCSFVSLQNCYTQLECEDVGGYWYGGACHSTPNPEICSSESLQYCYTQLECEGAGGYWYNAQCNSTPEIIIPTVVSAGQVWMDRNLGASHVATSVTDDASYGDLYQWGRDTDGHEKRDSGTTVTLSNSDNPGHSDFIIGPSPYIDWRSPQNDNLWQGADGINNPCPAGFRIPTILEWAIEQDSWSNNSTTDAYSSPLKLVPAGYRADNGSLYLAGGRGLYWSATVSSNYTRYFNFGSGNFNLGTSYRANGFSVRCIKD